MSLDIELPSVDIKFIKDLILQNLDVKDTYSVGETTVYVINGMKPIHKRTIYIRNTPDNVVDYNFATGIAINYKLIGELNNWFVANRKWKDGGYFD